ncbi:integrase [Thermococcus sp.]
MMELWRHGSGPVAQPGMSAALARHGQENFYSAEVTKTQIEPHGGDIFSDGFENRKTAYLNSLWKRYKDEFRVYMEKEVKEGKLSERRFKDYWNGLNRFFRNHRINEAIDFLNIEHIPDAQVKGLKKFFKFLLNLKYKEIDTREIEAMNRQVKVKSSPKMQGKPADEKVVKAILKDLEKTKDYRYYFYLALIYTGGRASQILKLIRDIGRGKVAEKDMEVFGDIAAFDLTKYGEGKKRAFFAIMPRWLAEELVENRNLFKNMPARASNMRFLKKAAEKQAGASNIRDWFFNKALYRLKGNKTNINFIQSRNDEKGSWQNYTAIREALIGAVDEYRKLMKKGMFNFLN